MGCYFSLNRSTTTSALDGQNSTKRSISQGPDVPHHPSKSVKERKGTWHRLVSTFSWPTSVVSRGETVKTILVGEDRARQDASPEGSRSDTARSEEGEGETEQGGQMRSSSPVESMHPSPATVPCQYRTGRTLGSGTYAIVKEAIHIKTGKYYACKVINKKLMEGREYMVRNEIAVLKKVSSGHRNIVTLYDYFETSHNLYLCFDLCTGGELFDRICAKGNYYEADAAELVRTIFNAVKYIHDTGIVHRDLKPENLIFRTPAEEADVMIADFGLSRVMDADKLHKLTEICGTPGYMAPEIFKKTGHGKPVDVWAMGVITYFLLAGYTPFDRDTQQLEMEAIIAGDYQFKPEEYWANVSDTARDFVTTCLTVDPNLRPTAHEALEHKWLSSAQPHFVPDPGSPSGAPTDLLPHIQQHNKARKAFRKAVLGMMAVKRMSSLSHAHHDATSFTANVLRYKEESEQEKLEHSEVIHHHNFNHGEVSPVSPGQHTEVIHHHDLRGELSSPVSPDLTDLHSKLAKTSLGDGKKLGKSPPHV